MSTKSQLQGFEAVIVIVILMILILLGLLIYTRVAREDLSVTERVIAYEETLELFTIIRNLPEIQCSSAGGIQDLNCIDTYKAEAFSETLAQARSARTEAFYYYQDLLGPSRITLQTIHPTATNTTLYQSNTTANRNIIPLRAPIKVYNPVQKITHFGVLEVEYRR
ncbi:MAG: hypothetical protein HC945_00570 [Nitrosarchaeum sp.]|nr:hypothetical protein [Nitrosarchaeum sp.]